MITEKASESLRYSKEYATTTNNHQYKITFDIIPDNISNEASFELQSGTDDIPFTFYTIGNTEGVSDTFPQINQSKSFEITFDAALDNQFLIVSANVPFYLGGTSILIVVVVAIDTVTQIQTRLMSSQYEQLIKKTKFGR